MIVDPPSKDPAVYTPMQKSDRHQINASLRFYGMTMEVTTVPSTARAAPTIRNTHQALNISRDPAS